MEMSLQKRILSRHPALMAVALGVLCCMVFATASSAAVPPAGLNCVASDGKVNGRGSTYQVDAQKLFAETYRDDFCGNTPGSPADEAGNTMIAYNYEAAVKASATGSGNGLKAASCRTDAFAGTDIPYSKEQLAQLDGAPGATGGCSISFEPPFQPKPGPFPNVNDIQANIMSFPIAGSSVALPVHLTAANCGGTAPTSLSFTANEVSRIFGGDIAKWNDPELVANNASLSKCEIAITRVVRFDNSGTTAIFKNYLIRVDNERTTTTSCTGGTPTKTWTFYDGSPNTLWPGQTAGDGTCSAIVTAGTSGGQALITKLKETEGGVGYADLADAVGQGLIMSNVRNATNTSYQAANSGKGANCDYSVLTLPGATASDAVGLNSEDTWASNNAPNPEHGNATDLGSKYPICGLTFDLVYTGLDNGAVSNAISRLTADQRRTLYSYMTFVLSSAAQDGLSSANYAPLPSSWLGKLRAGFQANF
jgi:ABC-type phosphate transport system substrate-binding protein